MLIQANFSDLFGTTALPAIHHIVFDRYKSVPDRIPDTMNTTKSDRDIEQTSTIGGFTIATALTEGESVTYDDPVQGYDKTYSHVKYGRGFRVTQEFIEDGKFLTIQKQSANLGKSIAEARQTVASDNFNNAFTTSADNPNSEALCATNHALERGGTSSNRLATDADLSVTSLRSLIEIMKNVRDGGNIRIGITPRKLLVPRQVFWDAYELVQSVLRPDTSNNAANAFKAVPLDVVEWLHLTDADAWFLIGDMSDSEMYFFERKAPQLSSDKDFDADAMKVKLLTRFSTGWSDWRCYAGSQGA